MKRLRRLGCSGCAILIVILAIPMCFFATIAGLALDININQNPQLAEYFPDYDNYGSTSIQPDTITWSVETAASVLGQPIVATVSDRVGEFIGCLQDTGAADVRVYLQQINLGDLQIPPESGVIALLDQQQFRSNFTDCAGSTLNRRSSQPEPCFGVGTFTDDGRNFTYVFASTHRATGELFDAHFKGTLSAVGTINCFSTPEN